MQKPRLERYIDKIELGLQEFEYFMKDAYQEKKNSKNDTSVKLSIIENQIHTLNKVLKHATNYKNIFLGEIFNKLYIQNTNLIVKKTIRHYLSTEYENKNSLGKKEFDELSSNHKENIHNFNIHLDSFFTALNMLIDILENQSEILKYPNQNFIKKGINKAKYKIMGNFDQFLGKEEKIFGSVLENLKSGELDEIYNYEKFLAKYGNTMKCITAGACLNILPEPSFMSDALSIIPYSYVLYNKRGMNESKFNQEGYYKYEEEPSI